MSNDFSWEDFFFSDHYIYRYLETGECEAEESRSCEEDQGFVAGVKTMFRITVLPTDYLFLSALSVEI